MASSSRAAQPAVSALPASQKIRMAEFIALIAALMSSVALSIDAVLPALGYIAADLQVSTSDIQLVITSLFAGFAIGQLIYGPLSDGYGRLPGIYVGLFLFAAGCVLVLTADSLEMVLVGRFLQGFGVSGPRIIVAAIVRDCFSGRPMARVMSFVGTVFMLVPILAPMIGQVLLWHWPWQSIFIMYMAVASVLMVWTWQRLNETLAVAKRRAVNPSALWQSAKQVLSNRQAVGYTVVAGVVFGGFLGYLSSSQVVFQEIYKVGDAFPLYFSLLVFPNIISSLVNAKLVMRWGMYRLVQISNIFVCVLACILIYYAAQHNGVPPLHNMLVLLFIAFASVGLQFGNLNALALEPLGEVAGMGASIVGAGSTLISIPIGAFIGMSVEVSIMPLSIGLAVCAGASILIMHWVRFGFSRSRASGEN